MNTSLINVANNTTNPKVLEVANFLLENRNRLVFVEFTKDDGTPRPMKFVPDNGWNRTFGIRSTPTGQKIVATKCNMDKITVMEILEDGVIQPRTVNLRTVTEYHVIR